MCRTGRSSGRRGSPSGGEGDRYGGCGQVTEESGWLGGEQLAGERVRGGPLDCDPTELVYCYSSVFRANAMIQSQADDAEVGLGATCCFCGEVAC
jgi:hypothetical protein